MIRSSIIFVLLAGVFTFAGEVSPSSKPELKPYEWQVGELKRSGLVYAPDSAKTTPSPLIFAFHGHGGTAKNASNSFNFYKYMPDAIVVYLQGVPTPGKLTDPQGLKNGWQPGPGDQDDRDLKLFDAALATMKSDYKVDEKRIYVTGHSNGGGFTYLLWAQRGDVFAAVAPCAAIAAKNLKSLKPKPALHLAGETDALVKYSWQTADMADVRKLNGCSDEGKEWGKVGTLVGTEYPSKTGTPLVTLISPGGHMLPEGTTELISKFFKEHPKQ